MSAMLCKGCNGEYETAPKDGSVYFHACPSSVALVDRRDENLPSTDEKDGKSIKAAGMGIQPK